MASGMMRRIYDVYERVKQGDKKDWKRHHPEPKKVDVNVDRTFMEQIEELIVDTTLYNSVRDPQSVIPLVCARVPPELQMIEGEVWESEIPISFTDNKLMPIEHDNLPDMPVMICHCEFMVERSSHVADISAKIGAHPEQKCILRMNEGYFECSRPLVSGTTSGEFIEGVLSGRTYTEPLVDDTFGDESTRSWSRTLRGLLTLIDFCHTSGVKKREEIYRRIVDHCGSHYMIPSRLSDDILEWDRSKRSPTILSNESIVISTSLIEISFQGSLRIQFYPTCTHEPDFEVAIGDV